MKTYQKLQSENILRESISNLKTNGFEILLFVVGYRVLISKILVPLLNKIVFYMVGGVGFFNISVKEVFKMLTKVPCILGLVLIIGLSFLIVYTEFMVLTKLVLDSSYGKRTTIFQGLAHAFGSLKRLGSIKCVVYFLAIAIIGVILGVGFSSSLTNKIVIPTFIANAIFTGVLGVVLRYGILLFIFFICFRWSLTLPSLAKKEHSIVDALDESTYLYKKHKGGILAAMLQTGVRVLMLVGAIVLGYILIGAGISLLLDTTQGVGAWYIKVFLFILMIIMMILSIVSLPCFLSFVISVYKKYTEKQENSEERGEARNTFTLKRYILRAVASGVCLCYIFSVLSKNVMFIFDKYTDKDIEITAHRGYSKIAPENTLSAIKAAKNYGADYVEIDVMTTKDGEVVLFHDSTLKRFDGTKRKVMDLTLEELKKVDVGMVYKDLYYGETIPRLNEVLAYAKDNIRLDIELKPNGEEDTLAKKVVQLIRSYDMEDQVVLSSLSYHAIENVERIDPDLRTGYIISFGIGDFSMIGSDFIVIEYQLLSKEFVYQMKNAKKEVWVWTLNEKKKIRRALQDNAANIITDDVEGALKELEYKNHKDIKNPVVQLFFQVVDVINHTRI